MLHPVPTHPHPIPPLQDLRQTLEHSLEQTMLDLMAVRFPEKSGQTLAQLLAIAERLREIGDWLVCDGTWLGRYTVVDADAPECLRRQQEQDPLLTGDAT